MDQSKAEPGTETRADAAGTTTTPKRTSVTLEAGTPRKAMRVMEGVDDFVTDFVFQTNRIVKLSKSEIRFLKALSDSESLDVALGKAGLTARKLKGLLRRKDFAEVIADRVEEIAVRKGITADWWLMEGMKVWSGERHPSQEQMSVWKEIGARVKPRASVGAESGGGKVVVNINMDRLEEAKKRQISMNAEFSKEAEAGGVA